MGLTVKQAPKAPPVPAGSHHAVCFGVIDLGTQPPRENSRYPKREKKLLLMWELPDERMTFERDGVQVEGPRVISKDFTQSLHEKATLGKFLTAWRGRAFTPEELKGFNVSKLLGANCMLNIVHSDDGQYANIASVMPLPKGMLAQKRTQTELPSVLFDLDEYDGGPFPKLPQWVIDRIIRCDELVNRDHMADGAEGEPASYGTEDIPF